MIELMFLMAEVTQQLDIDSHLQKQILSLNQELSICSHDGTYQSLFALTTMLSSSVEVDTEWTLSQSIDSAFLSCPLAFMLALKSASPKIQDNVLVLFGKYGQPTDLAVPLWALQSNDEVGAFVRQRFSAFGLVEQR